jgi:glycolate oxidase iron-sulfur subunit
MPNINSATARVLDAAGIQTLVADDAGCCGAIRTHLSDHEGGLNDMRRNIDAWWPLVQTRQIEALVMNASGCGVTVKEYGRSLAHDPAYADKAAKISAMTKDVSELLPALVPALQPRLKKSKTGKLAYHPPCTLQHGQQRRGDVEAGMRALGFDLHLAACDSHLCCGSAGTYSVLQPELSKQLRDQKLQALAPVHAETIVSGNIGCIQQLQSGTQTPVRHWIEVLDAALGSV